MEAQEHWIYYLKLQRDLPREYLVLNRSFREKNKTLIPITISGLLDCAKVYKSLHVVVVIKSYRDFRYFDSRVKKLVKLLIRSGKVNIYLASSFSLINDSTIMKRDYYNFIKLPASMDFLCGSISRMVEIKESQLHLWPGRIPAKVQLEG